MTLPADTVRALLEERARVLAKPVARAGDDGRLRLVTFAMAGETYAIEARHVFGVFRLLDLAPLPGAGESVAGLTSWRGDLLPVLDLRVLLGLAATGLDDRVWVVAVGRERPAFGLLAGAVEVTAVRDDGVRTPGAGVAAHRRFIRGVTDQAVLVLDANELLRHGE